MKRVLDVWYRMRYRARGSRMFIKRSRKRVNGKVYEYAHLVSSYNSANGPRHRVLYSLGKLDSIPPEQDKELAVKLANMMNGQLCLNGEDPVVREIFESMKPVRARGDSQGCRVSLDEGNLAEAEIELIVPESALVETAEITVVNTEIVPIVTALENAPKLPSKAFTGDIEFRDAREAGPVWVGHNAWKILGLSEILKEQKFTDDEIGLTEALTLNRLIEPTSEYSTPEWIARTGLSDILGKNLDELNYRKLYGQLDRLHEVREPVERELFNREVNLFNLDTSIYLYDLTSTYFEGQCKNNQKAKHGYSRDKRSDCRQLVVGLMLNKEGFPIGHEVFDGNKVDSQTVESMLDALTKRTGERDGLTFVVDRGMSDKRNLELIRSKNHHYIVAAKQTERQKWLAEFETAEGWHEIMRSPSPSNPKTLPTGVKVKLFKRGEEVFILCISQGRIAKDRAIRERQEVKLLEGLEKLKKRVDTVSLKTTKKVHEAIGRLRERYQRVGRYYQIDFNEETQTLTWQEDIAKKQIAEQVDGGYLLKTSRTDLDDEEIWRTYTLLTRVEAAFRDFKSPLAMRPIYHQLQQRAEAHIFVCVLSYHLLTTIERLLHNAGITKSWESIRKKLSTHQIVSAILPGKNGLAMVARKDTIANPEQRSIYSALGIPSQIFTQSKVELLNS